MAKIIDAISSLIGNGWRFEGVDDPETAEEFFNRCEIKIGIDNNEEIIWSNDPDDFPCTFQDLIEEKNRITTIEAQTVHQAPRRNEYPDVRELADAIYWQQKGDSSKLEAYIAAVEAVKLKYPKPE